MTLPAPPLHRRSLRFKVLMPFSLLALAVTAAVIFGIRAGVREQFAKEMEQRGRLLAHFVNYSAEIVSRPGELQRIVAALGAETDVLEIVVMGGAEPRVLASTNFAWLGRSTVDLPRVEIGECLEDVIRTRQAKSHFNNDVQLFNYTAPLLLNLSDGSKAEGAIVVHVDTRPMEAMVAGRTRQLSLAVLAGLAVLGGLGFVLLDSRVLRPIAALNTAARQQRDADSREWEKAGTDDEIGALAHTLREAFGKTDAALRELRNQKFALDQHAVVAVISPAGLFTYVNDKFCILSGYAREELIGQSHRLLHSGVHTPEFYGELQHDLAQGRIWHHELCNRAKNGTYYWTDSTLVPLAGAKGEAHAYISIQTDITARKLAEKALEEREQLLSSINANLSGASVYRLLDRPDGRMECAYISPNVVELIGVTAEQIYADAQRVFSMILPEDLPDFVQRRVQLLNTGGQSDFTLRLRTGSGAVRWLQFRSRLVERRADGTQVRDGVVSDITAIKQTEHEFRAVRQRLERALRASRTCTWENDVTSGRVIFDVAWAEMLGRPPGETEGGARALIAEAHPEDRALLFAELRRTMLGEADDYHVEHRAATAAGEWIWISSQGRVVERDDLGRARRIVGTSTDITARRKAEDEVRNLNANLERLVSERTASLARSEAELRLIFDHSIDGLRLTDADGMVLKVNDAYCQLMKLPREELEGRPLFYPYAEQEHDRLLRLHTERFQMGQSGVLCTEVTRRDGVSLGLEVANAVVAVPGQPPFMFTAVRDVTERKRAEVLLRQSDERFRAVFDRSPIIMGLHAGREGRLVEFNQASVAAFGYSREEALGRTSLELGLWADPTDRDRYLVELRRVGYVVGFETKMRRKNGEVFTVLYSGSRIQIDGEIYSLNSLQDISAQRASEQRLEHALEATSDGVWDWNVVTNEVYFSPQWQRLLGFQPGEVPSRVEFFFPLVHPDDAARVRDAIEDHLRGRTPTKQTEVRLRAKGGDYRWFLDRGKVVSRDAAGAPLRMVGTITDITERKRAERALMFTQFSVDHAVDALFWIKPDATILYVNEAAGRLLGYRADELIGRTVPEIDPNFPSEAWPAHWAELKVKKSLTFESEHRTKSGEVIRTEVTANFIEFEGEEFNCATMRDVTERKRLAAEQSRLQERVFQNQKYEALGTLAGGVAHDFNNILTAVINFTALARDDSPPSHPQIREYLAEVLKGSERAKQLVRQILLFSRSQDAEREPQTLQRVLKDALSLLRSTLPTAIEIKVDFEPDTSAVLANATQIHQIMMNLGINAGHAMQGRGGVLSVRLSQGLLDATAVVALPELRPGPYVNLEVSDTGTGIDSAVLPRIFDPFFTTKRVGEGTGLGLAVVRSVVRAHGGAITVRSEVGVGTTFLVYLPVVDAVPATSRTESNPLPRGRGQHLLVVDDEPMVMRSMQLMIERLGYRVTACAHPDHALGVFRMAPGSFDAVITDFQMPGKNGLELAIEIRKLRPDLLIFISSGYTGRVTAEEIRNAGVDELLPKPTAMDELARILNRTLK